MHNAIATAKCERVSVSRFSLLHQTSGSDSRRRIDAIESPAERGILPKTHVSLLFETHLVAQIDALVRQGRFISRSRAVEAAIAEQRACLRPIVSRKRARCSIPKKRGRSPVPGVSDWFIAV